MKKVFTVLWVSVIILCLWQFVWQSHALSNTPAGSDFYYMWDTNECKTIDYMCEDGWDAFSDNNGCGCKKTKIDPDVVCTMEYAPVCGQPTFDCPDGALCMRPLPETYSNKCVMKASGAEFLYEWKCEQDKPVEPKACPENWDPVCGKTQAKACLSLDCAQHLQTYSNMCFLEADKATLEYEGKCETIEPPKPPLPKPTKTKYYVADIKSCELVDYQCEDGWRWFSDRIGCGCEKDINPLPDDIKSRIDTVIGNFIKKLEAKWYSDEKILNAIQLITVRLELLRQESPKYWDLIDYVIYVLRTYADDYEDDFSIIEKIFKNY